MSNKPKYITIRSEEGITLDYCSTCPIIKLSYNANISSSNIKISHNTELYRIWCNIYKIDKILLTDNVYIKTIDIFKESFDDNNNYLEYINYNISNTLTGSFDKYKTNVLNGILNNYTINNYSDFLDYISMYPERILLYFKYDYISVLNKQCSIEICIYNFNYSLYNTTMINNINNMNSNINTIQENIIFLNIILNDNYPILMILNIILLTNCVILIKLLIIISL